jgi:predicted MFS family arabinose efflux permease
VRRAADLLRIAPLRRLIVISGLQMAAWELYIFYVPVYGHSIGLPASTIGIILACFAAATFVIRFALPSLTERWRTEQVLSVAMLFAGVLMLLFPLTAHPFALMLMSFTIGIGLGCGQPLSMTLAFDRSPPGRSGEVTGLRIIATNLARFVVPLIAGSLGAALGPGAVFWMNALNLGATSYLARPPRETANVER